MTELILLALLIGAIIYFIPAFLAKDKKHATGIILVNSFLGWTLLGWVVALVWAVSDEKNSVPIFLDSRQRWNIHYKQQYESGKISLQEYQEYTKITKPQLEEGNKATSVAQVPDVYDKLKKLKALLETNVINQDEFEIQKKKLLS